jgi:hypothetical protein
MVRRWSYLENQGKNIKLETVYFKKTFKSTVRFKKFSFRLTKLVRKKFNLRKVFNSHYNLPLYSFKWSKLYRILAFTNKLNQIDNFFLQKNTLLLKSKQHRASLIIASIKIGVALNTLHLNPDYHIQPLITNNNYLYLSTHTTSSTAKHPKLGDVNNLSHYISSFRRLITFCIIMHTL